jgi:transposase
MRTSPALNVSSSDQQLLEGWSARAGADARRARRARIILLCAEGRSNREVARKLGVSEDAVALWRKRFLLSGVAGIVRTGPRPRARSEESRALVSRILETTLRGRPHGGRWSTRSLARALGVNHMLVHRVWQTYRVPDEAAFRTVSRPGPVGPVRSLDLLGLFSRSGWRAYLFGAPAEGDPSPSPGASGPGTGLSVAPPLGPGRDPRALCSLALQVLEQATGERKLARGGLEEDLPALLVFLQGVERATSRTGPIYLIYDPLPPGDLRKLTNWLDAHPRFAPFRVPPGKDGLDTVERLLYLWATNPELRLELRNVGLLLREVGKRSLERGPSMTMAWTPLPAPLELYELERRGGPRPEGVPQDA